VKLETLAKEYLIEIEVRKYTPTMIRGYRIGLNLFLRFCKEYLDLDEWLESKNREKIPPS
jgi:hypothetical protein